MPPPPQPASFEAFQTHLLSLAVHSCAVFGEGQNTESAPIMELCGRDDVGGFRVKSNDKTSEFHKCRLSF